MTLHIVSRAEWGALAENPARLSERQPSRIVGVTVHHTASSGADPIGEWRGIQRAAMSGKNVNGTIYGDIEYNDGFDAVGRLYVGRAHHWKGAHALSARNLANETTLGLAYIGNGDHLTAPAIAALRAYLYLATLEIGHRPLLFDHADWRPLGGIATHCPGAQLETVVQSIRDAWRHGN